MLKSSDIHCDMKINVYQWIEPIFRNRGGHVWWKFESLTIILKENHDCIISLNFGSNWHFTGFIFVNFAFVVKCSIFSNGGGHDWWSLKLSTIILKGNHKCIIFLKYKSNYFREIIYIVMILFKYYG
jgi:hypothetical protein